MDTVWGLTGPQFLLVYCGLAVAAIVVVAAVRVWAMKGASIQPPAPLDLYQLAYLAGGPVRVADTALAGLIDSGAVRVNRKGRLQSTGGAPSDDVQRQMLGMMGMTGQDQIRLLICRMFARTELVEQLRRSLEGLGLIVTPDKMKVVRRAGLLLLLVLVVGVVRLINGIALGRPVSLLVPSLIFSGIAFLAVRKRLSSVLTPRGKRVVKSMLSAAKGKFDSVASVSAGGYGLHPAWAAVAIAPVALYGLTAYPDASIRSSLGVSASGSGSSGSSCNSCSGGDSGGGGGCGGGCGG